MNFAFISLGCSKNLVDSENLTGILVNRKGFQLTNDIEEADMVLINTCGFIGDAKKESIETILEVAEYKQQNLKKIVVCGCLAQRYAEELLQEIPEIDAVIGTGEIDKIERVVDEILQDKKVVETKSFDFLPNADTDRLLTTPPHTAYLKISEGCNRRCTYCIIPQLRGNLRSRSKEDILEEARHLVAGGVRELNLLAQETTEYGIDRYGKKALPDLLRELVKIEELDWIRSYYMFPKSITDELIAVMKTEEKICKYFDIPIQHISSNVLRRMGRAITGEQTKELLYKIRREIPDAVFRTSLIVGFPGETEEEFEELKSFVEEFQFDYIGVFQYSREEDTLAYTMEAQVPEEIKARRQAELINLQNEIAEAKNRKLLGREVEVLIDGISSESEYMLEGRLKTQALDIDGKVLTSEGTAQVGEIVHVVLEQNFEYDFIGRIVQNEK
ncbi:ribosomal protein S12 methylthiotransferase RimO [Fusobacterium necrophorum subsp. funduliforme ATCC 51357]|uniref:Ribosomal protein uS12 methylthiotransferase RimO n=2 Tax=Fusobacterium necrophorum TaxID=859 RepID=A0A162JA16_9FUSO|nr:30S ribosomal protein S12 methylthiotransferase RimO [Fusobacterium necrophorum]AYV92959.1 30S ribosomal protein S12 methylthiotransferase RimO [Fusobacterium necrophorum subsp. funduliforme]EIJ68953.1 ribosomal protein S12 methylthiotransferase RimO [Fusobacterium necrophorum subsp. funduliforme ATCC 51357]KAB0554096.1 30S ribosomal protein S12 methylthiotransferase RimO [Fusobacterium necrophorum subsp. funduliforme]KDE63869.1 ribosomal protein S12 methylthiotransferase [Fusobacterium necr